jgi:DNA-binding NarL/FixJ family response regulator
LGTVSGEIGTRVAHGQVVFGPAIAKQLIRYFSFHAEARAPQVVLPELTDHGRKILDPIAAGKDNHEIAGALFHSLKTVRNYISNIFARLHLGATRNHRPCPEGRVGLGRRSVLAADT